MLVRAAELRSSGLPWADVADRLTVGLDDLRSLADDLSGVYDRLCRQARRSYRRETMDATVTRLRELLKSQQESVALLAATTLIRYDLAFMRREVQHSTCRRRHTSRRRVPRRDETPPPPSAASASKKARCDTPSTESEVPLEKAVEEPVTGAPIAGCDSSKREGVTSPVSRPSRPAAVVEHATNQGVPVPPTPAAAARSEQGKTSMMGKIRRKKWLPAGFA